MEEPIKKFTGKKALMWFVGFFLIIFTVNGIMAYLAVGTWGGLETEDAYRKGIRYNDEISAASEQKQSGWIISLVHRPKTLKGDRIDIYISWPETDLPPAQVTAVVGRAVTNRYDQQITLTMTRDNIYTTAVEIPEPGQWNIKILVKRAEGPLYQLNEEFFITE